MVSNYCRDQGGRTILVQRHPEHEHFKVSTHHKRGRTLSIVNHVTRQAGLCIVRHTSMHGTMSPPLAPVQKTAVITRQWLLEPFRVACKNQPLRAVRDQSKLKRYIYTVTRKHKNIHSEFSTSKLIQLNASTWDKAVKMVFPISLSPNQS